MDTSEARLAPISLAHDELLTLIEPTTGPITDLRMRVTDERGAFTWTAIRSTSGETVTGTCKVTLTATDAGINVEISAAIDGRS